ncbi:hypothetical protein [Methylorubrum salsuginis]|uniref:hypothetical protein n=1 Tax=Methylorubrum salsuginis TaxID=414703 RepID=UPI001041CC7A|nr:hypothetical protein [Methylorubrum salsuginis]
MVGPMYSIFNRAAMKSIEASFQDALQLAMKFLGHGSGEKIFRSVVRTVEHRPHDGKARGKSYRNCIRSR